jgi:hypothetical protein
MRKLDGQVVFSPTDLVGFLDCAHLTELDRAVLAKVLERPYREDPELDLLRRKGLEHERRYLQTLFAPMVVAGSIDSDERIGVVRDTGAWGFTIGGAVFDRRCAPEAVRGQGPSPMSHG